MTEEYKISHLGNRKHPHASGFAGRDSRTSYYLLWFKDRKETGKYLTPYLVDEDKVTNAALRFFISKQPYGDVYPNIPYRFKVQYIDYCTYIISVNDGPSLD